MHFDTIVIFGVQADHF